ncbi:VWA domain-containing protein, partial [Winogradskyella immobilis]
MKHPLQFQKKSNKYRLTQILLGLTFLLSFGFSNAQNPPDTEVVITKTATPADLCNQFNVTLSIEGNPPVAPQEVILVIDRSGSMDNIPPGGGDPPIEFARVAAIEFVNEFFDANNDPNDENRLGLVSYAGSATRDFPLSGSASQQAIINQINIISGMTDGFTDTDDALDMSRAEFVENGTFDCRTSRSVILLTDGVPQNNDCNVGSINNPGTCITRAIDAAEDLEIIQDDGEDFNQNIFSIGLVGALNGPVTDLAEFILNEISNTGPAFITDNNAILDDIYAQILGQLVSVARQLPGEALVTDTIPVGFNLVPNTFIPSRGTVTSSIVNGDIVNEWSIEAIFAETVTLTYTIVADDTNAACGITNGGLSVMRFENSFCEEQTKTFANPDICIPCPEIDPIISRVDCSNEIEFDSGISFIGTDSCGPTTDGFAWEFFVNDVSVGTANTSSGTFTLPDASNVDRTLRAELSYTGAFGNNGACTLEPVNANVIINIPIDPTIEIDIETATCPDLIDASITVTVSNGTPPFTYVWTLDGNPFNPQNIVNTANSQTINNIGVGNYEVVVTDNSSCSVAAAQAVVTSNDAENPEITVPATITIEGCDENDITADNSVFPLSLTQSGDVQSTFASNSDYNASDDVEIASITYIDTVTSTSATITTVERVFTVTDACGNFATTTQTINISDTTDPTITCPADITDVTSTGGTGDCEATVNLGDPT